MNLKYVVFNFGLINDRLFELRVYTEMNNA